MTMRDIAGRISNQPTSDKVYVGCPHCGGDPGMHAKFCPAQPLTDNTVGEQIKEHIATFSERVAQNKGVGYVADPRGLRYGPRAPAPRSLKDLLARTQSRDGGCALWLGPRAGTGYGAVRYKGRVWRTHRLAWLLAGNEIPAGMHVCHRCDVRLCINPDHLFVGTRSDNMRDCVTKGRHSAVGLKVVASIRKAKTHCKHGHEFTPENTLRNKGGFRRCLACKRIGARGWRKRRSA